MSPTAKKITGWWEAHGTRMLIGLLIGLILLLANLGRDSIVDVHHEIRASRVEISEATTNIKKEVEALEFMADAKYATREQLDARMALIEARSSGQISQMTTKLSHLEDRLEVLTGRLIQLSDTMQQVREGQGRLEALLEARGER